MLDKINQYLQRMMPILTPLSLVIGVFLEDLGGHLLFLVPWLFAFMTFAGSLSMNFQGLRSFTKYPWVILITIAFLHILMPIWAYLVSSVLFHDHLLTIGFVLSVAVPTGVTSFIWVSICKGHLPLCLSIILIDTMLSPIVIPLLSKVVVGQTIEIDTISIMLDLLWMIVLPSFAAVLLNEWTKGKINKTVGKPLAPFQKLSLFLIVMINSSAIAPFLKNITWDIFGIIMVVLFLAASGYAMCFVIGHFLFKDPSIVTTVVFTGGMRNIAVGVVIASTYFPAKVVMPVVFGMLFQQILASQFGRLVEKYKAKVSPITD
ncbi:bile acid:sodium symporter family protein [Lysinibacillus endophyticus]|uniref:Bile acid:sodium symporter family protein n=1 Tax=Ureibacillus endophyticus TaxID=1978490 RepID=A0A494YSY0_9BACL|nr:bile acid:sodium symporter family protein [Lysinibacillus endophyticus]RKQ13231.1 bile acid:sodium symporter family protein [Lysinibacillus endophyticus]